MPPQTRTPLQRRRDLEIAKRQFTFLVSITATIFILCPQCLRIYRNLCIVPALAWLTGFVFDLINSLSDTWDNAPTLVKYFMPDLNIPITAPFDQICTSAGPIISRANSYSKLMALEAKSRIVALRQVVLLVLANWFLRQPGLDPIGESSGEESEDGAPGPAPISGRWYGLLVKTPPVHEYGSLSPDPNTKDRPQPIPWDSHETSSVPPISPTSDFRVHLSFCLVPKPVWESRDTTLAEKLNAGIYWDVRGEYYGSDGKTWSPGCVQTITGIEILGLVDEDQGQDGSNYEYFASLKQSWNYMEIFWNDVDFAIILGFLVTGPQAAQTTKDLFIHFSTLRISYLAYDVIPARAKPRVVTALATGLAAAVAGPVFAAGWILAMGFGLRHYGIGEIGADMWKGRIEECRYLQRRFPQLEELFEDLFEE